MRRTLTSFALAAMLFALSFPAEAQQPKKVYRIGYLSGSDAATDAPRSDGIQLALRELGYVEGQNTAIEYRYAEGKQERIFELAAELVRLKVDVIVTAGGTYTVQMAKVAAKAIPIVMVGQGIDAVEADLVETLARHGGNVTGITNLTTNLGGKRLELLKEAVAKLARVAVLYNPVTPSSVLEVKEVLPAAAGALGLTIRSWGVRNADGFNRVFAALDKQRPDGLYVPVDALMTANLNRIVALALKSRLPSIYGSREAV